MDLFSKTANPRHRPHSLLPRVKSCNQIPQTQRTCMNCPDVTSRCIVICPTLSL